MSHQMVFINLPVKDLPKSRAFFSRLGYGFNEQLCDGAAACLVLSEPNGIYAMLLTHEKAREFTPRKIADARSSTEVLICLSAESRDGVERLVGKALEAGASEVREPIAMGDFMYGRSFADLDGHIWEILWMDPATAGRGG
jgi:uncharacterized protein